MAKDTDTTTRGHDPRSAERFPADRRTAALDGVREARDGEGAATRAGRGDLDRDALDRGIDRFEQAGGGH